MPITFAADGPDDILDKMIASGWQDVLLGLPRNAAKSLAAAEFEQSATFEVFYPTLEEIDARILAGPDTRRGWRNLLQQGSAPVAQIEADEDREPLAVHQGPAKDGIAKALAIAEDVADGRIVAAVECPPIAFFALLIRGGSSEPEADEDDLVIPYEPDATGLEDYHPISAAEALMHLRDRAGEIRAMDRGEEPTGG